MMNTMKKIQYLLLALVGSALCAGCSDDLDYTPGAPDEENTYGVYFPAQRTSTELELEPSARTQITYTVKRTSVRDAITVPVVVQASEQRIFIVEPIRFAEGEDQTTVTVYFPEAKIGTEYTCSITVEDPHYKSFYESRQTGISFSVLRAGWKLLGKGMWRDDILSSTYNVPYPYGEVEVSVWEREDKPGYYRVDAFTPDLLYALFGVRASTEGKKTVIDATDKEKVWIPKQSTGVTVAQDDGFITIASYVDRQFSIDASDSQYGTLRDGVITFPAQSILVNLSKYMSADEWANGNTSGKQRLVLPGAHVYDYSATLTKSEPADGVVKIGVTMGSDAKRMTYKFFEGALDEGQVGLNAQELDGKAADGKEIFETAQSGTLNVRLPQTGIYTLVGCVYGEGDTAMREYAFVSFGYVAEGDERPVLLSFGLEGSNELAGQGITTDNAVKFYAYGEGITSLEFGLFRTDRIKGQSPEELLSAGGREFTSEQLAAVNGKSFRTMLTGLNGDSDYTLVVRAGNDYVSSVWTKTHKTTGKFNPAMESYTYADFIDKQPTQDYLCATTWNYYATNLLEENPVRRRMGNVAIGKDASSGLLALDGFIGLPFDKEGEGRVLAQFNGGLMALNVDKNAYGTSEGQSVYLGIVAEEEPAYSYSGQGLMLGGAVAEGYVFFVANPEVVASNQLTFSSILVKKGSKFVSRLAEMMLVDASKDITPSAAVPAAPAALLERLAVEYAGPCNCVELRGLPRLEALLAEEPAPLNLARGFVPAEAPALRSVAAGVTFESGVVPASDVAGTAQRRSGMAQRRTLQ